MDVLVGWRQLDALHVHPDGDRFIFVGAAVHYLVFYEGLRLGFGGSSRSECFLSHQGDLHALDLYLDQVEVDSAHNDISQMVEGFVVLKVDVKAILNTDLHFHGDHFSALFDFLVRQQHSKIDLLGDRELVVFSGNHPDEVSHTTCDAIEGFILLFEVGELKLEGFGFGKNACGFEFLGERCELGAEIFIGVYF